MPIRDFTYIKLLGNLVFGLGTMLLLLTLATVGYALIHMSANPGGRFSMPILGELGLALVMSFAATGCGSQLRRVEVLATTDPELLRLNWTALFTIMVVCAVIGGSLLPILALIAIFILIILIAIRNPLIRVTSK